MKKIINELLTIPSTDADDARRRKLLNILLMGMAVLALLTLSAALIVDTADVTYLFFISPAMLVLIAALFAINRYVSGPVASTLFVLVFTIAIAFADEPEQVVNGRSVFLFTIPILMASVILRPWASFVVAGLSGLVISALAIVELDHGVLYFHAIPVPTLLGFFAFALVAWLSARSLEQALVDLRILNRELDQRVVERTRDLAEALSRNQAILEGIADGVVVFDNHGTATVANPAMTSIADIPYEEIVGQDIHVLIAGDVNEEDQEIIYDLVRNSIMISPRLKFEWGKKTLSATFAPVRDNVGKRTGTVAVFRDFTREAELERLKSTFVSRVSHELRTPLNAIIGYADMLRERVYGPVTDDQQQALDRVTVNARRQLGIVNDLLDQAQIEAGTIKLRVEPFATADLIEDVMGILSVLAQSKDLELAHHIEADVPKSLPGDPQRLQQVLINLIDNAIKFTTQGSVHVRLYRPNPSHWAIEVSDTGCGIPLEAQSYIFDPFQQVDSSTTRKHTGSGLGLAIVKQLVQLMEGEVAVKSKVGQGSIFTVVLPLVPMQIQEEPHEH